MNTQYFIIDEVGNRAGPYDLVYVVKKIRNGSITKETMISLDKTSTPHKAEEIDEIADFLQEAHTEAVSIHDSANKKTRALGAWLKSGWNFLQANQLSTLYSGSYVVFLLLSTGTVAVVFPPALVMLGYASCFMLAQFFFTGYFYSVLRMVRGQPVDLNFIKLKMQPHYKPLLVSSLMMSFFIICGILLMISGGMAAIFGLLIVALPGFYKLTIFIFAPLLILDKGMNFWDALETSRKTIRSKGMETTGIIFALLIINFVFGLLFLIPMIVTLPITMAAISEMYDETFV